MLTKSVIRTSIMALLSSALVFSACGKDKKNEDTNTSEDGGGGAGGGGSGGGSDTVTLSGKLALAGASLVDALADLQLYCVTFQASPQAATSPFGDDGSFAVTLPKSVNFGCFVNRTADNSTIGTFVVAGTSDGLGAGSSGSIALSANADLGELTIGADGRVSIPADRLEASAYKPETTGIEVDLLHDATYTISCADTDADRLAACKESILDGGETSTVYFRVLKGTEGGESVQGIGAWKAKESFDACGGFDISPEMTVKDGETMTFSQGSVGDWAGANCEVRDEGDEISRETIKDFYMLSKLVKSGDGYSVRDEQSQNYGDCTTYHTTAIDFTGTTDEMFGAFSLGEVRDNCDGQGGEQDFQHAFLVKFTRN